jgi:hypothetical protein
MIQSILELEVRCSPEIHSSWPIVVFCMAYLHFCNTVSFFVMESTGYLKTQFVNVIILQ